MTFLDAMASQDSVLSVSQSLSTFSRIISDISIIIIIIYNNLLQVRENCHSISLIASVRPRGLVSHWIEYIYRTHYSWTAKHKRVSLLLPTGCSVCSELNKISYRAVFLSLQEALCHFRADKSNCQQKIFSRENIIHHPSSFILP